MAFANFAVSVALCFALVRLFCRSWLNICSGVDLRREPRRPLRGLLLLSVAEVVSPSIDTGDAGLSAVGTSNSVALLTESSPAQGCLPLARDVSGLG